MRCTDMPHQGSEGTGGTTPSKSILFAQIVDIHSDIQTQCAGAHFTGAPAGYSAKLTLTVTWAGNGSNISPPSIRWRFSMTETLLSSVVLS